MGVRMTNWGRLTYAKLAMLAVIIFSPDGVSAQALGSPSNPLIVNISSGADYLDRLSAVSAAAPASLNGLFWVRYNDNNYQQWGNAGSVGSSNNLTTVSGIKDRPYYWYEWGYWFGSAGFYDGTYYAMEDYFPLGYDPDQCPLCVLGANGL